MFFRNGLLVAVCLVGPSLAYSAPDKADEQSAAFSKLHREWKGLVARLAQVRARYRSDPNADKKALEAEFEEKLEKARQLEPELAEEATKAYLAEPNKDSNVSDYLFAHLSRLVTSDDFEPALKLVTMLIEHKFEHKFFNYFAGMTYFATNDFDKAKKYLTLANESKEIDDNGKRYLELADNYKPLWEKEQAIREAEDKADDLPKVKLTTSKGDIVILLLENEAPIATANFISLVEKKFYDGLKFHRVIQGFMAQGGDPKGDGSGGPGYTIPCECSQVNHRTHFRGSLSMAHAGKDTGGSQFFLTFVPTNHLDGKHTVFGRVIEGFDVLPKLQRIQPGEPGTPDKIVKATVLRKRNHKYEPVKRPDKNKPAA